MKNTLQFLSLFLCQAAVAQPAATLHSTALNEVRGRPLLVVEYHEAPATKYSRASYDTTRYRFDWEARTLTYGRISLPPGNETTEYFNAEGYTYKTENGNRVTWWVRVRPYAYVFYKERDEPADTMPTARVKVFPAERRVQVGGSSPRTYWFDSANRLKAEGAAHLSVDYEYRYNEHGDLGAFIMGHNVQKLSYTYDNQGNWIQKKSEYQSFSGPISETWVRVITY